MGLKGGFRLEFWILLKLWDLAGVADLLLGACVCGIVALAVYNCKALLYVGTVGFCASSCFCLRVRGGGLACFKFKRHVCGRARAVL